MSEELSQHNYTEEGGYTLLNWEFYPVHSTTVNQLKESKIIPSIQYGEYGKRKPDGIIVDRGDKNKPSVIAVLEYKTKSNFNTEKQRIKAIQQCNDIAQVLDAKIGIITDRSTTIWINPHHYDAGNEYIDAQGESRSYSLVRTSQQSLQVPFYIREQNHLDVNQMDDETRKTYEQLKQIVRETDNKTSTLEDKPTTDPTPLAKSVWQNIFVETKSEPTACLYNVLEIFIFKFLSDLKVLEGTYSFDNLLDLLSQHHSDQDVLKHYANSIRPKIRELFPEAEDRTSIINGTIFVDSQGQSVDSQAGLFVDSLKHYDKFGDLKNIDKGFKTKLFETFLKQSTKKEWGQFLTPRKVVRAIVEMADIDKAKFICDPFCGVGGFILEPIQYSEILLQDFKPKNNSIQQSIELKGYDSGRADSEEQKRTIILAKANMLIYLSQIIESHPNLHEQFSAIINKTFQFLSDSNLGTLGIDLKNNKPDLILTNPPYIQSGSQAIKNRIKDEGLSEQYAQSGKGMEGLCLTWIIDNLKEGGSAFIILPSGIFDGKSQKVLRDKILKHCYVKALISLPKKTFFHTPKKTYILCITKKHTIEEKQEDPIFTYLASSIGETLDVNRFDIEDNDLDKSKDLFNQFKGSPKKFQDNVDPRCKIQPIEKFYKSEHWIIDQWWSDNEKIDLGILESKKIIGIPEYVEKIKAFSQKLEKQIQGLNKLKSKEEFQSEDHKLSELFDIKKGDDKYTKAYIDKRKGEYPVYSSQTSCEGIIGYIDSYDYDKECFTYTTDGTYVGRVFRRNGKFSMTTHCASLSIKEKYRDRLDNDFLYYELNKLLPLGMVGEDNNRRLNIKDCARLKVKIPQRIEHQREIASRYKQIQQTEEIITQGAKNLEKYLVI